MLQKVATLMLRVVFHSVSLSNRLHTEIDSKNRTLLPYDTDVQILQINDVDGYKNVISTTRTNTTNQQKKIYICKEFYNADI